MKAKEYIKKYAMDKHLENGVFIEQHYPHFGNDRANSGSILYYVAPGEHTEFHRIDCDEYWIFNAGSPLDIWSIEENGNLRKIKLGIEKDSKAFVYLKKGVIFASRLEKEVDDGTLVTCITVPRFTYDGFELIEKDRMIKMYPEVSAFWDEEF